MNLVDIITDNPRQVMNLKLSTGQNVTLGMFYSENQQGWFFDLAYGDFQLHGRRMVMAPNMLRAFRNFIPFGLALIVTDRNEPVFLDDFKNKRASLYTLNADDVTLAETLLEKS